MYNTKWLPSLACSILMVGCTGNKNACPDEIVSEPDESSSGLMWGDKKPKVSAQIVSVVSECIPISEPNGKNSENTETVYRIPVTASIKYEINAVEWFQEVTQYKNLTATIIFEAKSKSGVVLQSSTGEFKIISNSTSGETSATLHLLPGEIARVEKVTARWEYGRE